MATGRTVSANFVTEKDPIKGLIAAVNLLI